MRPLSIIIPCRNEERHIGRCLESLLASDYDSRLLEIVVVDGMSTDRTREIVQDFSRVHPEVRLLDNPTGLKPTALNIGIANTTADIVMRIDAHAEYARDYIPILVRGLELYRADNIGGIRTTDPGRTTWSRAIAQAVSHPFAAGNALYRTGVAGQRPRKVDTVFCGCYRREVFHRIGLFNEKLIRAQDREFNQRLRAHGGKIVLVPQAHCTYFPRTDFRQYARWTYEGSRWLFSSQRFTTTKMTSWRNWIPGLFVLWHAVALLAVPLSPAWGLAAAAPLLAYWGLNVFVSLRTAVAERSLAMFFPLVLLFATTHYSYGLGSVIGWWQAKTQPRQPVDCSPKRIEDYRQAA